MAATFQPIDAINYATNMLSDMPITSQIGIDVAQDALEIIWTAAPWRWTIGTLSAIPLSGGVQQFLVNGPPADFLRLDKCYVANAVTNRPVTAVVATQNSATIEGPPNYVSFVSAASSYIQFDTVFQPINSGDAWKFYAWYKRQTPNLSGQLSTSGALVMDDDYYWVYREWVMYFAFKYGYDQRAGGANMALAPDGSRQVQYQGQLGIARAALEELRRSEMQLYQFPENNPSPIKNI